MSAYQADCLLVILPEFYHEDRGFQLAAIWPQQPGIHGVNFFCGHDLDLALEWTNERNQERGHTPEFVTQVLGVISGIDDLEFYSV